MEVFDWGTGQSVDGNFKIVDSLLGENQTNYSNLILGVYKSHSEFFFFVSRSRVCSYSHSSFIFNFSIIHYVADNLDMIGQWN